MRFWPFVMLIDGFPGRTHVVSIYAGVKDPTPDVLVDPLLMEELLDLYQNGWKGLEFDIGFITADLPGMAKLKGCKGPAGYCSCYKCTIRGHHSSRFHKAEFSPRVNAPLRTNASFRDPTVERSHNQDPNTDRPTPFLDLPAARFDIVKTFVVDVMHAFMQNTTRKVIYALQKPCDRSPGRVGPALFRAMDRLWQSFKFPVEFSRPTPQSLAKKKDDRAEIEDQTPGIDTWKATQLRTWALYGSCMVLHDHANRQTTSCWRHLVFAMRLLCDKESCCKPQFNTMAEDFIKSFQEKIAIQFPR